MLPSIMHTIQCPLDNIKEKTLEEKDIKNIFNNKFTQESKEKIQEIMEIINVKKTSTNKVPKQ